MLARPVYISWFFPFRTSFVARGVLLVIVQRSMFFSTRERCFGERVAAWKSRLTACLVSLASSYISCNCSILRGSKTRVFFFGTRPGYVWYVTVDFNPVCYLTLASPNLQRPFASKLAGARPGYFERNASAALCSTARAVGGARKRRKERDRSAEDEYRRRAGTDTPDSFGSY